MKLDRRQFIALSSLLLGGQAFALGKSGGQSRFISAASDGDDRHWVIGFGFSDGASVELFRHGLPGRAHHIAMHEGLGVYIVLARRPGNWFWVGDLASGEHLAQINVPAGRHLYGHGVFSASGDAFYATENAWQLINGDSGRVVAWDLARSGDAVTMQRRVEFPSYGVGPHELLLMPDQETLVVANGGIRTHPERGREKLNLVSMQPSLVYLETATGRLLEQHALHPDYHQASIRHLDMNQQGAVVMGMQYEGEPFDRVPLLATHRQGDVPGEWWAPEPVQGQMKQYVGSVRFDQSGRYVAASCPRGNMITFWDAENGEMIESVRSRDGCGLCAVTGGFLFSAGTGRLALYDLESRNLVDLDNSATGKVFWDNHLSALVG